MYGGGSTDRGLSIHGSADPRTPITYVMLGDGGVSRIREFGQIACRPEVSIYFVVLESTRNKKQETRTKLLDLKSLKFKKKSSYIIGKKSRH